MTNEQVKKELPAEMFENFARIMITLSREEFFALKNRASAEYRRPKDQARYILRQALLSEQPNRIYLDGTMTPRALATLVGTVCSLAYIDALIDALIDLFEVQPSKTEQ